MLPDNYTLQTITKKAFSLIDEMYSTICVELAEDHFIGLV